MELLHDGMGLYDSNVHLNPISDNLPVEIFEQELHSQQTTYEYKHPISTASEISCDQKFGFLHSAHIKPTRL